MLTVAVVLFATAGVLWTIVPPYYHWVTRNRRVRERWWETWAGRWIMTLSVLLALLVDLTLVTYFIGHEWPGLPVVRIVLYAVLVAVPAWLLGMLRRNARRARPPA